MTEQPRRRLTPPWDIEDDGACFIVRDHSGQALSYVYYENEPGRRAAANSLTRDEARQIAINIANLPDLVTRMMRTRRTRRSCPDCVSGCTLVARAA
jgi:hypothetical protein